MKMKDIPFAEGTMIRSKVNTATKTWSESNGLPVRITDVEQKDEKLSVSVRTVCNQLWRLVICGTRIESSQLIA